MSQNSEYLKSTMNVPRALFQIAGCEIDAEDQRALVEAGALQRLRDIGERLHLVDQLSNALTAL